MPRKTLSDLGALTGAEPETPAVEAEAAAPAAEAGADAAPEAEAPVAEAGEAAAPVADSGEAAPAEGPAPMVATPQGDGRDGREGGGRRGRDVLRKLHVYKGGEHPHAGQAPQPLDIAVMNRKNSTQEAAHG